MRRVSLIRALAGLVFLAGISTPVAAQQRTPPPTMLNMQPLAYRYSADTGELMLVLASRSSRTDPSNPANREFHAELVAGERTTMVHNNDLRVVVLGDLTLDAFRDDTLFRFNIVIDESGSIESSDLDKVRSELKYFLGQIPVSYRAQVIRFATQVSTPTPFTNDYESLIGAIDAPRLNGETALFDAIDQALLELTQVEDDVPLSFTVAFTDGMDNRSSRFSNSEDFKRRVSRLTIDNMIPLFLAGVGNADRALLQQIADDSLGVYMHLDEAPDLKQLLHFVTETLKSTYVIGIRLSSSFRDLRTVNLKHEISPGNYRTVQDVPIRPGLIR